MLLYLGVLGVDEGSGLVQDAVGDGQLADVVQQTRSPLVAHSVRRERQVLRHRRGRLGNPLGVPVGEWNLSVGDPGESAGGQVQPLGGNGQDPVGQLEARDGA
jgi:hypothetical protein